MQSSSLFNVAFPFRLDAAGRVDGTSYAAHVSQQVAQVLFTSPGERVNLPDFGCGLLRDVFEPSSPELLDGIEAIIKQSLQRWLSDVIHVENVTVAVHKSEVNIDVSYRELATGVSHHQRYDAPVSK